MAKANKKAFGNANWWTKLTLGTSMDEQDINNKIPLVRIANKLIKKRKRIEKKLLNTAKFAAKTVKTTKKAKQDMIQYGIDLTKW